MCNTCIHLYLCAQLNLNEVTHALLNGNLLPPLRRKVKKWKDGYSTIARSNRGSDSWMKLRLVLRPSDVCVCVLLRCCVCLVLTPYIAHPVCPWSSRLAPTTIWIILAIHGVQKCWDLFAGNCEFGLFVRFFFIDAGQGFMFLEDFFSRSWVWIKNKVRSWKVEHLNQHSIILDWKSRSTYLLPPSDWNKLISN